MATNEEILRAAELVRQGRLVAFPTETVYGLGANALDAAAVERIYAAKGRPAGSPLIVHAASLEQARELVAEWPAEADALARRFWPGPLTLVLPKRACIPDRVTAGLPTVGLRVPSHPVALELIRLAGVPIAAPSANPFTRLSPTTAEHVRRGLGAVADAVLDGGAAAVGIESTVLSLLPKPRLLRPGMIGAREIEEIIGPLQPAALASDAHPSPGMHPVHYSPATPLYLVRNGITAGGRVAAVWHRTPPSPGVARSVRLPDDPAEYAAALYGTLHELDAEGFDAILVEAPPEDPAWAAIRDRLERASS
ncbi:MAG: L-threonylcarbamoyladenylate synthase [Bryobacteraceae bacterium]|nr:L-threonylcarbamoyladenylate synthase [Bryobacteraceae bacterium]